MSCEFQRYRKHRTAVESHPCSCVCLLQCPTLWKRRAAVKDSNVIEAEESSGKEVLAGGVCAIDPPREIDKELGKSSLQEVSIRFSGFGAHLIYTPTSPGMNRWIYVRKFKFIGWYLAVRMHVPFTKH